MIQSDLGDVEIDGDAAQVELEGVGHLVKGPIRMLPLATGEEPTTERTNQKAALSEGERISNGKDQSDSSI